MKFGAAYQYVLASSSYMPPRPKTLIADIKGKKRSATVINCLASRIITWLREIVPSVVRNSTLCACASSSYHY
jgi:hypothetical protein